MYIIILIQTQVEWIIPHRNLSTMHTTNCNNAHDKPQQWLQQWTWQWEYRVLICMTQQCRWIMKTKRVISMRQRRRRELGSQAKQRSLGCKLGRRTSSVLRTVARPPVKTRDEGAFPSSGFISVESVGFQGVDAVRI